MKETLLAALLMAAALPAARAQSPEPLYRWRAVAGDTSLNGHPAAGTFAAAVSDSLPYAAGYTMVAVYRPAADTETVVWSLDYGTERRAMTTERIMLDGMTVRYAATTERAPVIATLRQTAPDSVTPAVALTAGGAVHLAEVLYYVGKAGGEALLGIQSVLAIRYGITLGPVDWRVGSSRVWSHDSIYKYRVTGVGVDSSEGLFQLTSRSEMEGAMLTVAADTLPQGSFLLVGDDGGAMAFEARGTGEQLARGWKAVATRTGGVPFTLAFDMGGLATAGDTLALLCDSDVYQPTYFVGGKAVFEGVTFGSDTASTVIRHLALVRGGALAAEALRRTRRMPAGVPTGFSAALYPNPSTGHYTLEVAGARRVEVTVHDAQGRVVATHSGDGSDAYLFEGSLPKGSVYYATVKTAGGSQTLKLVVK